jgi:hypothetical protein
VAVSAISEKFRAATADQIAGGLHDAVVAVIEKAEAWRAAGMPWSALGDELLLVLAKPLGLRLETGQFAQLVDLDEEER